MTSWFRPLLVVVVAVGAFYVLTFLAGFLMAWLLPPDPSQVGRTTAAGLFQGLIPLTLMIPACFIALKLVGRRPLGTLTSVAQRMRWGVLGRASALATLFYLVGIGASAFLPVGEDVPAPSLSIAGLVALLLVALLLTPFQAAAEEYVFRGLFPQTLGAWWSSRFLAYGLPLALFTMGHLYNFVGLAAVAVMGGAMAWLTWRSGGLELAIAVHAANNTVLFVLGAFGLADPNATGGGWLDLLITIALLAVVVAVLYRWVIKPMGLKPTAAR